MPSSATSRSSSLRRALPLGGLHAPHAQRELDVLADGHVPEQRVVLEHQPDAALPRRHMRDITAMQRDAAMIDARQAGDGAQQRALAAAAGAEQHEELAFADFERDVVDYWRALIPFGNLIERNGHRSGELTGRSVARSVSAR